MLDIKRLFLRNSVLFIAALAGIAASFGSGVLSAGLFILAAISLSRLIIWERDYR